MKLQLKLLAASLLLIGTATASAQEFFDTSAPDKLVDFGVRVGVNTSNQTSPSEGKITSLDGWGTGFDAGAVVDLNIRDFLTLQPGFFFESRSHNFSYIYMPQNLQDLDVVTYGHTRSTWFKVPLLVSVRLNPAQSLRWSLEAGPVFGFGLGGSDKTNRYVPTYGWIHTSEGYYDIRKKWSFGWKLGTTFRYADHYLVGIHYEAGSSSVYKDPSGGRHKAWVFSIGYDF